MNPAKTISRTVGHQTGLDATSDQSRDTSRNGYSGHRLYCRNLSSWGFRRMFVGLCLCVLGLTCGAQSLPDDRTAISLLTCSPSDKAAYTLYGHSALRVRWTDTAGRVVDFVFNYGVFDFSKPNFIYRFARGETDYMLAVSPYADFLMDYVMRGSAVYEQMLNLTPSEKEALRQALFRNAEPQNRVYRYNFFYDNCSTRPVALLERCMEGNIRFAETETTTFREMINGCTRHHPWLTFGCDLVLGLPTDRQATLHESFFLPENVRQAFARAEIVRADGSVTPLILSERTLVEDVPDDEPEGLPFTLFTPLTCSILLFLIVTGITFLEWKMRRRLRWIDCLLFGMAAVAGCVLFFLCFLSEHPSIRPNLSVLWLHPFHWVGVGLSTVKKLNKAAYYYHSINFAAILVTGIGWIFLPQYLNPAFIPLMGSLLIRSGYGIFKKKENR